MASSWASSWGTSWASSWGDTGGTPAPTPPAVTSKGWPGDYSHPTWERKRKRVDDAQDDLVRAYEDATGITAERERQEAIRELKRAAATALSVAKAENDPELEAKAAQIVALNKLRLKAEAYLERAGKIVSRLQAQEDDDMEAFQMIARLV